MKLIIQIPCFNESEMLPFTVEQLPKEIEGVDSIEYMVIDDGSVDGTSECAREAGVHHIVRFPTNQGLAKAFSAGLERGIHEGADIIVNTDADNQYEAQDIAKLIEPILAGRADMVVGERPISDIEDFSWIKKCLQHLGSKVVRMFSHTCVQDAPSGFRAFSRNAAIQLNVFSEYTYTLETIIQAGHKRIAIESVPVRVNAKTRESRLVSSIPSYIKKSILTILRICIIYRPLRFFSTISAITFVPGFILSLRFLYYFITEGGAGHVQSVILSVFLMGLAFLMLALGLLADLVAVNRILLERLKVQVTELSERHEI